MFFPTGLGAPGSGQSRRVEADDSGVTWREIWLCGGLLVEEAAVWRPRLRLRRWWPLPPWSLLGAYRARGNVQVLSLRAVCCYGGCGGGYQLLPKDRNFSLQLGLYCLLMLSIPIFVDLGHLNIDSRIRLLRRHVLFLDELYGLDDCVPIA